MPKPTLFIGSSRENLSIAYALQENLDSDADVTVWDQGIFDLARFSLEALLASLEAFDFGVFVFAPDDITKIRGEERSTVRDNVVFELGLFVGRLGQDRGFVLMPRGVEGPHLPTDLFGLTVAEFNVDRRDRNLRAALGPACNQIRKRLREFSSESKQRLPPGLRVVQREEFTKVLLDRLADITVHTVRIITYTSEVDAGLLNQFHIKGSKKIEIYKRSILSDLAEEQECNVRRIASGSTGRAWNKKHKSMEVSEKLETDVPPGSSITQYLYDAPPSKRAYIFNRDEAVIAYYEVLDNPVEGPGSAYKGMTTFPALHVTRETPLGEHLLAELENHIAGLRRISRSWKDERSILRERAPWKGYGRRPCIEPRAVFLDLDGVLYDSLPMYVTAWTEAFASEGINFPNEKVYLEEGREGRETIRMYLQEMRVLDIRDELIERIHAKKTEVLRRLGPLQPLEGARDLVKAIWKSGTAIWVVTGSTNVEHILSLSKDFDGLINKTNVIGGQDVRAGKPDPDPYLLACKMAKVHPHEAIVIENAPLGIESANAAETFCIAVNTGPLQNSVLEEAGARAVFGSCSALAEHWDAVLTALR